MGGIHPRVQAIAVRADGLNAWEPEPARLRELLAGVDRPSQWTVSWGGRILVGAARDDVWLSGDAATVRGRLGTLAEAGVDELVLAPLPPTDLGALDRIASLRFDR